MMRAPFLPPLIAPIGLVESAATPRSRDAIIGCYQRIVTAAHERKPFLTAVDYDFTDTETYGYAASLGARLGKVQRINPAPIGTLRTISTTSPDAGEWEDDNGYWHMLIPKGWSTGARDLRKTYAMLRMTSTADLDAHAHSLLPHDSHLTPTYTHYRDLRMTDQWDGWSLTDLTPNVRIHHSWRSAWDSISGRIETARELLQQALRATTDIELARIIATIDSTNSGWLDPNPHYRRYATSVSGRATWVARLRTSAENNLTAVLPSRLSHLKESTWTQLLITLNLANEPASEASQGSPEERHTLDRVSA
jgi:hypothetical protein